MRLEFQQRQFVNQCVARARAFERQQLAAEVEALRAEIAAERDAFYAEMARVKAELLMPFFALQDELKCARDELLKLRMLHAQAQQEREQIWRDRMWAEAMLMQRDPDTRLQ